MDKTTILIFGVFVIVLAFLLTQNKDTKTVENLSDDTFDDLNSQNQVTTTPIIVSQQEIDVAPTVEILDAETGTGLQAIMVQAKKIVRDSNYSSALKRANNITGYYNGVSLSYWRNHMTSQGFTDEAAFPITPQIVDSTMFNALTGIVGYDFNADLKANGRLSSSHRMIEMLSISDSFNTLNLSPNRDTVRDKAIDEKTKNGGYGNCTFSKCEEDNWKKAASDINTFAENYRDNIDKFNVAVIEESIQVLRQRGFKFLGYDQ